MKIRILLITALTLPLILVLFGCKGDGALPSNSNTALPFEDELEGEPEVLNENNGNNLDSKPITEKNDNNNRKEADVFIQLDEVNNNWLQSFNQGQGEVNDLYLEKAILLPEKYDPIKGNNEISSYYKNNYQKMSDIIEIYVNGRIIESATLVYEIGLFTTDNKNEYHYVVIWKKTNNGWLRELEMIGEDIPNQADSKEIDKSRTDWMSFCNAHNSKVLVEELYTTNAFYYNQGRLLHGSDEISSEYSYMNSGGYSLALEPMIVKVVQPDLAYEIGKCSGSYGGHYILRWEKEPDCKWKVSLDSNY